MKQIRITLLLLLCMLCMGSGMFMKAEASSGYNLLQKMSAAKTPKGKWVRTGKGYRYQYASTGTYANREWLRVNGKIYFFNKKGYRVTGIKKYRKNYYYLNARGVLKTGWITYEDNTYYFSPETGAALTGWNDIDDNTYYFDNTGVMQTGCWVDNRYLGDDGAMAHDTVVDGYYVDEDGERSEAVLEDGEAWEDASTYIFVGDSRTVGMQTAVGGDAVYIGEVGKGYEWFSTKGKKLLKKALKSDPNAKVIFNLGVNDLGNISSYISCYQKLIQKYPEADFYFMSVNPIETKLAKANGYSTATVSNAKIRAFNASLQAAFPDAYLECYSYLVSQKLIRNVKKGSGTVDGIHYTTAVYKAIYDFTVSSITGS